jgi:hypothetical protein
MNKRIEFWFEVKEIFKKTGDKFDTKWQKRKRILNSQLLVTFLLKLVESKNKQGYGSNLVQFWESCLNQGIKLAQDKAVSASSLCEARQKLSEDIFIELNQELVALWNKTPDLPNFKGYRLFGVDGSRVNLPRELIKEGFKLYDKERGRYYPQGIMSCLYNLQEKVIYDFSLVKHMYERLCALEHLKQLSDKDVMIFDRGYFSYLLFYKAVESKVEAIFRMQTGGANKEIIKFIKSEKDDAIIEYSPSTTVKHDLKKAGYILDIKTLSIRLIKTKIGDETYIYATTLLDSKTFPTSCFAEIYHGRWGIEELYKISKKFIEIEEFHAKTERGVRQEVYAHILLINLSRFFEYDAQKIIPPTKGRIDKEVESLDAASIFNPISVIKINFKNCLLVVGRNLESLVLKSIILFDEWLQKIINSIARIRQKIRPKRHYPRISHKPWNKWSSFRNQHAKA